MKKSLILLSMLALSVTAFAAKPTLPKSYTVRYTHNFGRLKALFKFQREDNLILLQKEDLHLMN
ncbi:hypothetical protein HMPREF3221_00941 [Fusobacterium nucleatum]|uniref:Uncharacterized protein n=1 Tax=Fusobacterium nucleatum TaxID=851 RepID=A0A133P172_FUSNU|nr:hypothetical protein HMPREF3221_00941 [Fusobacterium nucleatum]